MNGRYVLKGHDPVPCEDLLQWARWFGNVGNRRVALDEWEQNGSRIKVSTVFLGLDHSFGADDGPVLFETMVFGGPLDGNENRYSTWEEAEIGHKEMVTNARTIP